jgi:hypothetical protein
MAEVRVSNELLRARLFAGLNAEIVGVRYAGEHIFIELDGPDVPKDCREVMAVVTVKSETIRLEPIK